MTSFVLSEDCYQHLSDVPNERFTKLALVLGDQLNAKHSWFQERQKDRLFVLLELRQETDYCRHHIQKVVGFFAAMRNYANALVKAGHHVLYLTLDATAHSPSLTTHLEEIIRTTGVRELHLQQPDEYRVDQQLQDWQAEQSIEVTWFDSEHFLTQRSVLQDWFGDKPSYLMEYFYRRVRKQTGYLMEQGKPLGGKWNFDKDNRKTPEQSHQFPPPITFATDVSGLVEMLQRHQVKTMGTLSPTQFLWPVSRRQSLEVLDYFITHLLPRFGDYQDAMVQGQWSMYHSRLSFALNTKMLSPHYVVEAALHAWQQYPNKISLNQVEGFVRQIIGWREFVRAIYWQFMPDYQHLNALGHQRALPEFYWDAQTEMNCLQQSIQQSLDYAYAHHIQRLMVTGNFALLSGCDPAQVDAWYLGIYIDALEWVEMPNTRGMSQFADGGIVATKPYVSSGSYIQKMSNYCDNCYYDVKQKTGPKSCPFNSLYWHFIDRNMEQFDKNPRMALIAKQWQRRDAETKRALLERAEQFLAQLN